MRLRSFTASDIHIAMEQVREAMGEDAVIISTARAPVGDGVTVTAAVEEDDPFDFLEDEFTEITTLFQQGINNGLNASEIASKIFKVDLPFNTEPHTKLTKGHAYPLLNGDTIRVYCEFEFNPHLKALTRVDDKEMTEINDGDSIFCKSDYLESFIKHALPKIQAKFMLFTRFSAYEMPRTAEGKKLLDDPRLIVWIAKNPFNKGHPKLVPMPLGFNRNLHGSVAEKVFKLADKIPNYYRPRSTITDKRPILAYVNFNT